MRGASAKPRQCDRLLTTIDVTGEDVAMTGLVGRSIVGIAALDGHMTDPTLTFTGGAEPALVADSDWDPWVLHLPGIVLVDTMVSP